MPGEVDRLARDPCSFYGSSKSTRGYSTRQTVSGQQNGFKPGLNARNKLISKSQMNGGKLNCNRLTFGSSNKITVHRHQNGGKLVQRHCRYLNMQVRHLPRHQFASSSSDCVNGSKLSSTSSNINTARWPNVKTLLTEKTLATSRQSRVLISAELKHKADREMKKSLVSVRKSADCTRDECHNSDGSSNKKVSRSDQVKQTDRLVQETSCTKGVRLRNGRSLLGCKESEREKSVTRTRQYLGNRCDVRMKKFHVLCRSRSLSPTKSLALARPRRSVVTKKSVCYVCFSSFF